MIVKSISILSIILNKFFLTYYFQFYDQKKGTPIITIAIDSKSKENDYE